MVRLIRFCFLFFSYTKNQFLLSPQISLILLILYKINPKWQKHLMTRACVRPDAESARKSTKSINSKNCAPKRTFTPSIKMISIHDWRKWSKSKRDKANLSSPPQPKATSIFVQPTSTISKRRVKKLTNIALRIVLSNISLLNLPAQRIFIPTTRRKHWKSKG